MFRRGHLQLDRLIGEQLTLDNLDRGLDRLASRQAMHLGSGLIAEASQRS